LSPQMSQFTKRPADAAIVNFLNELIATQPRHPGGYDLLATYYLHAGNHRAALAMFRKVKEFASPDYPDHRTAEVQVVALEKKARWEQKLPSILSGELVPASAEEFAELADYCATFEQKYALATRFVLDAIKTDPDLLWTWMNAVKFADWVVQAAAGRGAD